MESINTGINIQHLAGIVPIAGQPLEFNMPWHDAMIPVAANYFAIEKSIYECALAGCETIWLVAHYGTQPLIRKRIGDFVVDPKSYDFFKKGGPKRLIPVYYVPISPKDRKKRDSLAWSVLYGAYMAHRVSKFLSKWTIPQRFYCSFPYGIPDPYFIMDYRLNLSKNNKTIFTYKNKSVKDNLHISFTFDPKDYFACRDIVKQRDLGVWREHKINAALYDLQTVYKGLDTSDARMVELPWFYDISTWDGYREFLASEHSKVFKRPTQFFTKYKKRIFLNEQDDRELLQQDTVPSEEQNQTS